MLFKNNRWHPFIYIDIKECYADGLFAKENLKVKFIKDVQRRGTEYIAVLCAVREKDVERFEKIIGEELMNKMLICGHSDYPEASKKIANEIKVLMGL